MQFSLFLSPLLLSAFVSSSSLSLPRQADTTTTILSDISTIDTYITLFDAEVKSYNGSSYTGQKPTTIPFVQSFENLESAITTTTSDVRAAGEFSEGDSDTIAGTVLDITEDAIQLLVDVMGKVSVVTAAGYKSDVLSALNDLYAATDDLFTALDDAVTEEAVSELSASQEQIASAFEDAISDYS